MAQSVEARIDDLAVDVPERREHRDMMREHGDMLRDHGAKIGRAHV